MSVSGKLVPRTNRQAIVAAENPVADQRAQFVRDRPLVLDRQVGDAAPRIEPVRRRKSIGRARVEAAAALAAMVALGGIRSERQAEIDLAKKQPGAELARHQIGVLALP